MTKEELVRQAAKCLPSKVTTVKEEKAFIDSFVRGAEWMQAMMIKKAAEWLKEEMHYKDHSSGRGSWGEIKALGAYNSLEEFIEDFKQAMEE